MIDYHASLAGPIWNQSHGKTDSGTKPAFADGNLRCLVMVALQTL